MTVGGVAIATVGLLAGSVLASNDGLDSEGEPRAETDAELVSPGELEEDTIFGDAEFLGGRDFHGAGSSESYTYSGGGCLNVAANDQVTVGLNLPDGADIGGVFFHTYDNSGAGGDNVFMNLWRYETSDTTTGGSPSAESVFAINSDDGDDSGFQTLVDATPASAGSDVIDNSNYTYAVVITGGPETDDVCGVQVNYFYEDTSALTFHQTEPCALFDTRPGRGGLESPLTSGGQATFDLIQSDYSGQGGVSDTSGCDLPSGTSQGIFGNSDGTVAVLVNLVAVNPQSFGNLKIWDTDDTEPDGGVVVFTGGENNSNAIAIGVDDGGVGSNGGEVIVKNQSAGSTHVRGVVLGYYTAPPTNQE